MVESEGQQPSGVTTREHIISGHDEWRLSALDVSPPAPRAVVVAGHAMMVDRRTLWRGRRPSLGRSLVEAGFRVLLPDLRGHGHSGPHARHADWGYGDLVLDTGAYIDLARQLLPDRPVVLLGHSLFGHTSLAYLGLHPSSPVAAVVAVAVNIWARQWDPTMIRWLAKRAVMQGTTVLGTLFGYVPAARWGLGSADEAWTYWRDLSGFLRSGVWGVGIVDYHQHLERIPCPVLHVLSDGDRLYGRPDDALRFSAPLARRRVLRVGPRCENADLRALVPGHMEMVTSPSSAPLWQAIASWIAASL